MEIRGALPRGLPLPKRINQRVESRAQGLAAMKRDNDDVSPHGFAYKSRDAGLIKELRLRPGGHGHPAAAIPKLRHTQAQ